MIKKSRDWLGKYSNLNQDALPAVLRRKLLAFRIGQGVAVVSAFGWAVYTTLFMLELALVGIVFLALLHKLVEPRLDRALAATMKEKERK